MTNSISIDNFSKLNHQLEELKVLIDSPKKFLAKFFLELRNDINSSFIQQNEVTSDEHKQTVLLENWLKMIARLNEFERDCFTYLVNQLDHQVFDTTKIKLSQLSKTRPANTIEHLCQEIQELIQDEKLKIERILFRNRTITFMNKLRLSDNLFLTDYDSKKKETVRLFDKMDLDVTVGKLIIINDDYLSKDDISMLKNKIYLHYKSTFDILKSSELKKNLRLNLDDSQVVELSLDINNLTEFNLNGKNLTKIDDDVFKHFKEIRKVKVANNQLKKLSSEIFSYLPELSLIWLQNNQLKVLDSKVFRDLKNLTHLNLSGNQLIEINSMLFHDLIELVYIDLSFNNLKVISSEAFRSLIKLKYIDLSNNSLIRLSSKIFNGLTQLEYIYLNDNQFRSIDSHLFSGLINLKLIDLANCELESLNKDMLRNLINLESVNLENNMLATLDPSMLLIGLDNLKEILVKGNPGLRKIDTNLFYNLSIDKWRLFQ